MYNALKITPDQKILIAAPHPDDETIGCGGILALYAEQCDVLLLTDGRKGVPADGSKTEDETAEIRSREFAAVMERFGVKKFVSLQIPDSQLRESRSAVEVFDFTAYDLVFVPNRNERHVDHKAAFDIVCDLCRKQKAKAQIIEYEVWSPIIAPNRFLDISDVMEKKADILREYVSQTGELDYEKLAKGLNSYRGAPHHVDYCEAYFAMEQGENSWKRRISAHLPRWSRKILRKLRNLMLRRD